MKLSLPLAQEDVVAIRSHPLGVTVFSKLLLDGGVSVDLWPGLAPSPIVQIVSCCGRGYIRRILFARGSTGAVKLSTPTRSKKERSLIPSGKKCPLGSLWAIKIGFIVV